MGNYLEQVQQGIEQVRVGDEDGSRIEEQVKSTESYPAATVNFNFKKEAGQWCMIVMVSSSFVFGFPRSRPSLRSVITLFPTNLFLFCQFYFWFFFFVIFLRIGYPQVF